MTKLNLNKTAIAPHTSPRLFRAAFALAGERWPGKTLTLTGTDLKRGVIAFQEWGNPEPLLLDVDEVAQRAKADMRPS